MTFSGRVSWRGTRYLPAPQRRGQEGKVLGRSRREHGDVGDETVLGFSG